MGPTARPATAGLPQEVRLRELRGIGDLRVPFTYPVSVLAGQNGCGKSTVLFALACAYKVPGAGVKDFAPSTLFPDSRPSQEGFPRDMPGAVRLTYSYLHDGERAGMQWAFNKRGWTRSFEGKKNASQPERSVVLRRLRNLGNPCEVRSMLQLGRADLEQSDISSELLSFAQQVLPFRYARLVRLSARRKGGDKEILYAVREDEGRYSEFHMSAGERGLLRLSSEISRTSGALILIDEIEAGLHPYVQQQLMLQLQRLALRNDLQVVVATHSPAVLDSVPAEARLFLERSASNVELRPTFRDVIQRAFYGRSFDRLSILCEDDPAEAIVRGVFDVLKPRLHLFDEDVEIGHDTGKSEFPAYVRAIARFRGLDSFVFVLDGDARDVQARVEQAAHEQGQAVSLIFLPGAGGPEEWVWTRLAAGRPAYAKEFGLDAEAFGRLIDELERLYATAADSPANKAKGRVESLSSTLKRTVAELCRAVARRELEQGSTETVGLARELEQRILTWRSLRG